MHVSLHEAGGMVDVPTITRHATLLIDGGPAPMLLFRALNAVPLDAELALCCFPRPSPITAGRVPSIVCALTLRTQIRCRLGEAQQQQHPRREVVPRPHGSLVTSFTWPQQRAVQLFVGHLARVVFALAHYFARTHHAPRPSTRTHTTATPSEKAVPALTRENLLPCWQKLCWYSHGEDDV